MQNFQTVLNFCNNLVPHLETNKQTNKKTNNQSLMRKRVNCKMQQKFAISWSQSFGGGVVMKMRASGKKSKNHCYIG
jgi:hypothetical protein